MFWVDDNLIISPPGEGQEVIIKSSFCCWWKGRSEALGCLPPGLDRLKVSGMWLESDIVFRGIHTQRRAHIFPFWWMGKYAFLALRALVSSETLNLDFLHTEAVLVLKEVNGIIQTPGQIWRATLANYLAKLRSKLHTSVCMSTWSPLSVHCQSAVLLLFVTQWQTAGH